MLPDLEKWDSGTKVKHLTGIAANDCHHNQVFILKMIDAETVALGTVVDKDPDLRRLTAAQRPGIRAMTKGHQPGDVLAKVDIDPYEHSFLNVSTHVMAPILDEQSIRSALKTGHAFVAHDWMCDATGFVMEAIAGEGMHRGWMGDEVTHGAGLKMIAKLPVEAYIRVLRQGREIARFERSASCEVNIGEPGAYRLEAWLSLDGELRPWIFSNPIYVK